MIGIYKITSPSNKIYIGQSWNIHQREIQHRCAGSKKVVFGKLYNSIKNMDGKIINLKLFVNFQMIYHRIY